MEPRFITLPVAVALACGTLYAQEQAPRFHERVDVARVVVDARVVDDRGNPILGLSADDFAVKINRKICRVETAAWIGEHDTTVSAPVASPAASAEGSSGPARATGVVGAIGFEREASRARTGTGWTRSAVRTSIR